MNGDYECKWERMKKYLEQVRKWMGEFQTKFVQILKEENKQAYRLVKAASAEHMLIPNKVLSFVQLLPFDKWRRNAGNRLGKQLDHTDSFLFERWHMT